ncbi:hypothetical protein SO802_021356 [Lithocarpus litseifolius]|uniref:DUF7588 domain-containing protein n=1 Tax=Lithocarpus litseifolius TaxID=425828 RepID=A0AAW2CI44_9ROSI
MGPVLFGAENDHLRLACRRTILRFELRQGDLRRRQRFSVSGESFCEEEEESGGQEGRGYGDGELKTCTTGPKRVELEDRSEEEKKTKMVVKCSVSSSVKEISDSGDDSVFPEKISVKKRRKVVDEKVGVKPLIRLGLNNSILLALRDTRHIRFNDSLLGTIETSLSNGPVHFDCFPNFTIHLHDPHVMKALTLNSKTHGTLMVQGTSQIALIDRVYYKCIKTNMNVGALDRKKMGETLLIQTNVQAKIQIPRTLKWSEVSFPESWKLENENYPLEIQNPDQNLDLDFVQQLADGSVRLSFEKSRFRSPLDDYRPRSPIDLRRSPLPTKQPPILLGDRPASQASSSGPLAPYPRSRRDLDPEFQGVKTRSQVSTPCYTAKQDSVVDQNDDNSQKVESPSGTDIEDPYQDYDLKVLRKAFELDMDALGKEFDLEKKRVKREAYRANHTREQKVKVLNAWKEFMKEVSDNIPFFEYFENYFSWHRKTCKKVTQVEDRIDNKVILQPENPSKPIIEKPLVKLPTSRQSSIKSKDVTALEIVTQKLEELQKLVKKEPVTPSPSKNPQLTTLHVHTASSRSSRTSSDNEKEIEHIED